MTQVPGAERDSSLWAVPPFERDLSCIQEHDILRRLRFAEVEEEEGVASLLYSSMERKTNEKQRPAAPLFSLFPPCSLAHSDSHVKNVLHGAATLRGGGAEDQASPTMKLTQQNRGLRIYVTQCLRGEFLSSRPAMEDKLRSPIWRGGTSGGDRIPGNHVNCSQQCPTVDGRLEALSCVL
ncbi:hypothetical protein FQN60_005176 [Etheostoma spectabile]|uniref:Uncharacterized protein n=1 Tax=Etheostoma spectabile TaxID=54343 RepID=A0A5J5DM15_9PERO|nr:hypothetical protein FQN60_005176 [Etheostoma spectabile]